MKKFFTHLILFTALMLCSASSWAQLMVCGHSVDLNATSTQTITGSGISGTVTYNPSNKTLTLDNATLTSSGINDGIYNQSVEGLDILFRGTTLLHTQKRMHLKQIRTYKSLISSCDNGQAPSPPTEIQRATQRRVHISPAAVLHLPTAL